MSNAIEVKDLTKEYKTGFKSVDSVSFEVKHGEIFGILGPNGAGKTTTLEMIEGIRPISSGEVYIKNIKQAPKNRNKIQQKIGIQLQSSSYFDLLSLKEILKLFGSFYKKRIAAEKLLEQVKLGPKANEFVKNLSGGQAQRFSIVAALVNDPDVVFLDEPTTGLDPQIRRSLWELIREINKSGKTVVLTTHYMEEAEELCERVAIMDGGQIIAIDSPQNLITNLNLKFTIKFVSVEPLSSKQIEKLLASKIISNIKHEKEKYILKLNDATKINDTLNLLEENKVKFKNLEIIPPNLEDVFLELTGKKLK